MQKQTGVSVVNPDITCSVEDKLKAKLERSPSKDSR